MPGDNLKMKLRKVAPEYEASMQSGGNSLKMKFKKVKPIEPNEHTHSKKIRLRTPKRILLECYPYVPCAVYHLSPLSPMLCTRRGRLNPRIRHSYRSSKKWYARGITPKKMRKIGTSVFFRLLLRQCHYKR